MKEIVTLRSGVKIPRVKKKDVDSGKYITRSALMQMHLSPKGDPVAFDRNEDGTLIYYFDPARVTETPPELWYRPIDDTSYENPYERSYEGEDKGGESPKREERPRHSDEDEELTLESGSVIYRMSTRRAASYGYYSKERLAQMMYETAEEPVAFSRKGDGTVIYFYDKRTANRLPLLCVKCGKDVRFRRKLCKACYEEDLAERRAEGDAHRSAYYGMDPARVLFFDLELTGVYSHDEIISISIVDGYGKLIMDTLIKPVHTKRWKRTEKIHGITPAMVQDAPTLSELTPKIKEIFENADNLIAYGVSTDYSHIKNIYATEKEQLALHDKVRCCANEFVRFTHEHRPDVNHAALVDAMECFGVEWEGIPHSSVADTLGCCHVWNKLFPRYYIGQENASLDVPTYEVHHHDKAGNIIPDETVVDLADMTPEQIANLGETALDSPETLEELAKLETAEV